MQWKDKMGTEMEDKVKSAVPLLGTPGADVEKWSILGQKVTDEKGQESEQENLGKDRPEWEGNGKGRSWKVTKRRGRKKAFEEGQK